ncbi:MAG: hypothetical protein Q8R58_04660 [Sulfuricurvum sp.]|nr:hypothetical protein [Sulfuricurvum sp.]
MKALSKYIVLFFIVLSGLFFEQVFIVYKHIILDTNIITLMVGLISGLFGFIVAVIPFAIQLFNQDNKNQKNDFLNKLMENDKFNFFVKPMFSRFIKMLQIMFLLFLYAIFLTILASNKENLKLFSFLYEELYRVPLYKICITVVFYVYLVLMSIFFINLKNIIRDLQTLVFNFFKSQESIKKK